MVSLDGIAFLRFLQGTSVTEKETNDLRSTPHPSTDKAEDLIKSLNFLIQKLYILIQGDYNDALSALTF